jgi:hypothetical protein
MAAPHRLCAHITPAAIDAGLDAWEGKECAQFVRNLGLAQYANSFAFNLRGATLPALRINQLAQLGVGVRAAPAPPPRRPRAAPAPPRTRRTPRTLPRRRGRAAVAAPCLRMLGHRLVAEGQGALSVAPLLASHLFFRRTRRGSVAVCTPMAMAC